MTRTTLLAHAWAQLALVLAIALVAGHLASALPVRLDLTDDQRHSLSAPALAAVAGLEQPVTATVWFTADLGPPYHAHRTALLDLLAELQAASGGQLQVVLRDPSGDPEQGVAAREAGIRPVTWAARDFDQTVARQVWMGLSLDHGARHVAIGALPAVDRMEHDLVRGLLAVTTVDADRRTVGWLQGNGEPGLSGWGPGHPLGQLIAELQTRHQLVPVDASAAPIPDEVDALLIVGPQLSVGPTARAHLDAFAMRGGAVAAFVASWQPDFPTMSLRPVPHELGGLLATWGVQLGPDPILDRQRNEAMGVPVGGRLVQASYPLAPVSAAFDRVNGPVRDLPGAVLPFSTAAAPIPDPTGEREAAVWLWTEATARSAPGLRTLELAALKTEGAGESPGPHPVISAVRGQLPSAFPTEGAAVSAPTRLVVAGSADLVANNPVLVLNAVDWLLEDPRLVQIRSRNLGPRPLDRVANPGRAKAWIAGPPFVGLALIALLGLRRRRR